MFNIKYKGKYTNDKQLIKRKEIPKEAIEFGIVENLSKELGRGFLMLFPIIILMLVLTILKVKDIKYHLTMNIHVIISFFIVIISIQVLTIIHEYIHALIYPKEYEKGIWKSKEAGAYFVYCEGLISKGRWMIMCLAPMFVLGIIPFVIWYILPNNIIPMPYYLTIPIITWFMTIMSMGDIANTYYVIKEVPNKAKIFNYGFLRSFYIKKK